jgi:hypothetical protein
MTLDGGAMAAYAMAGKATTHAISAIAMFRMCFIPR